MLCPPVGGTLSRTISSVPVATFRGVALGLRMRQRRVSTVDFPKFSQGTSTELKGGWAYSAKGILVKADDGNVFWNAQATLLQGPDGAEGDEVVISDESFRKGAASF